MDIQNYAQLYKAAMKADKTAATIEGYSRTIDMFLDFLGDIVAEHLAHADNMLGSPGQLIGLKGELLAGDLADRAFFGRILALVNVTANGAYPLFHNRTSNKKYKDF